MQTFLEFLTEAKAALVGYELTEPSRHEILKRFPPKYPEVLAHHITVRFPAKPGELPPPMPHSVKVVGYADSGDGLEALVIELDGTTKRPGMAPEAGGMWHTTLSVDRKRAKPVQSNQLIQKGYQHVPPFHITVEPKITY